MKRTSRGFWTMLVLAIGMTIGFSASALGTRQMDSKQPSCTRDSDCDDYCGGPGTGVCHAWMCWCTM